MRNDLCILRTCSSSENTTLVNSLVHAGRSMTQLLEIQLLRLWPHSDYPHGCTDTIYPTQDLLPVQLTNPAVILVRMLGKVDLRAKSSYKVCAIHSICMLLAEIILVLCLTTTVRNHWTCHDMLSQEKVALTLSDASTCAPFSSNTVHVSEWPAPAAWCNGVLFLCTSNNEKNTQSDVQLNWNVTHIPSDKGIQICVCSPPSNCQRSSII